jgi:hypothetical protein
MLSFCAWLNRSAIFKAKLEVEKTGVSWSLEVREKTGNLKCQVSKRPRPMSSQGIGVDRELEVAPRRAARYLGAIR